MSSIIKSTKVSLGKTVELDLPQIIKNVNASANKTIQEKNKNLENMNIVSKVAENELNEDEKEKILTKYMEEARKKSELFFETEMKKAYDEGIIRAKKKAENIISEAEKKADNIISDVSAIKKRADEEYKQAFTSMESEIVNLSVDIAQKILNKEIEMDSEYILNIVKDAIDKVTSKNDILLKVSEKDYTIIIGNMDIMLARIEGFSNVKVIKESALTPGSCIVETEYGTVDGSLNTRVEQVKKEFYKMLNR